MIEKDISLKSELPEEENNVRKFVPDAFNINSISSAETIKRTTSAAKIPNEDEKNYQTAKDLFDTSSLDKKDISINAQDPIFKELSAPKLPELARENRARLQMQSPTRLNFYWSTKSNPVHTLHRIFGKSAGNYTLVVKLVNQSREREEIFPIEAEGSAWFDVYADSAYRAEIGFYAPFRPFVRLMFSNIVQTPRKGPSPHRANSPHFAVSANQFAEVLDVSGFRQDAFEVALAGDDFVSSENATQNAFAPFVGNEKINFVGNDSSEVRFVLLALASGISLENLRGQISESLFSVLQQNAEKLSAEKAFAALRENFGVFSEEASELEYFAPAVFGASLINFPHGSKRRFLPKFAPISSLR